MEIHPIQRLKAHLKKLGQDLKPMTFIEKLDHLWTYYKWVLIVVAVIAVIISIVCTSIANLNRETLISGMLINTNVDLEGHDYLSTGYFEKCQGVEGEHEVELMSSTFQAADVTTDLDFTYNSVLRIVANVNAQELDYVITDVVGLEVCLNYDMLMDLREILTAQELELLEEDLIYLYYEEEDVTVPVAVNLRNQDFYKLHIQSEADHYIAFMANTPRKEACRDFWEYLLQVAE